MSFAPYAIRAFVSIGSAPSPPNATGCDVASTPPSPAITRPTGPRPLIQRSRSTSRSGWDRHSSPPRLSSADSQESEECRPAHVPTIATDQLTLAQRSCTDTPACLKQQAGAVASHAQIKSFNNDGRVWLDAAITFRPLGLRNLDDIVGRHRLSNRRTRL